LVHLLRNSFRYAGPEEQARTIGLLGRLNRSRAAAIPA
jgi:hypothetical protein